MDPNGHLCLSGHPHCSGVRPCPACFDFLVGGRVQGQMVWPSGGVVSRAMFLAGPPFNADPNLAALFMRAYGQAFHDGVGFITQMAASNHAARGANDAAQAMAMREAQAAQAQPRPQAAPPATPMTEERYLLTFQEQLLQALPEMSEHDRTKMCQGIATETLDGWSMLSEREKDVMRGIFLPPEEVVLPGDEPLPSNESAQKVVDAMRSGTLGPTTLDPPRPTPPKDLTPAVAVAAPAEVQAEKPSPPASSGGETRSAEAGHNGTDTTNA